MICCFLQMATDPVINTGTNLPGTTTHCKYTVIMSTRDGCSVSLIRERARERERERVTKNQPKNQINSQQQTVQMNTIAGCHIRHQPINAGRPNIMSNKLLIIILLLLLFVSGCPRVAQFRLQDSSGQDSQTPCTERLDRTLFCLCWSARHQRTRQLISNRREKT